MPHAELAIVAALEEELAAVRAAIPKRDRAAALLVCCGVGWDAATRAAAKLLDAPEPPRLICSTGFCGGLTDLTAVGDIVLAAAILGPKESQRYTVDPAAPEPDSLREALARAGLRCHTGAIVSVREPVTRGADKRALGLARQALAADMESFAMAERAGTKAAVCALRVVSDAVGDELPAEVGTFLDEKGSVRVGRVARYALRGPASIRTLRALKARRDRSLAGLTAAWRVVWPLLRR